MNKKGRKENLKAEHPENTNAEKSGVYSARRRAEEADKVRKALAADPEGFIAKDEAEMYASLRACSKLLANDLAERGVSDRKGEQRRQVGTYLKNEAACLELNQLFQARMALAKLENDKDLPWAGTSEAVKYLSEIVRNRSEHAAARIAAMKYLHELVPAPEKTYDQEFYEQLQEMSDADLERELNALMIPITTDTPAHRQEWADDMIRRLGRLPEITEEQRRTLRDALTDELDD